MFTWYLKIGTDFRNRIYPPSLFLLKITPLLQIKSLRNCCVQRSMYKRNYLKAQIQLVKDCKNSLRHIQICFSQKKQTNKSPFEGQKKVSVERIELLRLICQLLCHLQSPSQDFDSEGAKLSKSQVMAKPEPGLYIPLCLHL